MQATPTSWRRTIRERPRLATTLLIVCGSLLGIATGALVALAPVWVGFGALVALVGAYGILRSPQVGLASVVAVITLLPFGTLPFKAAVTPSFLELTLAALLGVWLLRLLAIPEYDLRVSALGGPILGFLGLTIFSLLLGANGLPDNLTLHNYLKFVLGVVLFYSVLNTVRTTDELRWAFRLLVLAGAAAALLGVVLRLLNDVTALNLLVKLGRIGYPTAGRVLRYIEDDPARAERAIATSVDPNSFGGMLAFVCALSVSQLWAKRPVLPRPVIWGAAGILALCTFLTYSRAALIGLTVAVVYLAVFGDRRMWWLIGLGAVGAAVALFGFGIGDEFLQRFTQGVQFQDQAQLMRLAEYRNAIEIIKRYPVFGVGFGTGPELGLITGVSSIYLAMGERLGLVGLGSFLAIMLAFFVLTWRALSRLDPEPRSWLLGVQAALIAALVGGLADHYFFNIEFAHMVALFWGTTALGLVVLQVSASDADSQTTR